MIRRIGLFGALTLAMTLLAWGCGDDEGNTPTTASNGSGGAGGDTSSTGGNGGSTSNVGGAGGSGGAGQGGSGGAGQGGSGGAGQGGSGGAGQGGNGGQGGGGNAMGSCMQPISIMLSDSVMGDTSLGQDNLNAPCQVGSDSEIVYEFLATASGTVGFTLTSDADLGLNVRTTCNDNTSVIACADANAGAGAMESVSITVENGMTYYIVVDGYDMGEAGTFTLAVDAAIASEICNNMMDDNGNTLIDCEEASCVMDANCSGPITTACAGATPITPGTAQMGDTTGGSNVFAGSCTGFGSAEQLYSYTPAQDQVMTVVLQSASDQGMVFRTSCDTPSSQFACVDAQVGGTDELARHLFLAGATPITMFVEGFMAGDEGPYTFTANAANISETEPNNDYLTANTFASGFVGYIPSGDNDFIAVTTTQTGTLTVSATDVFAGDCANSMIDTEIELFDTDGVTSLGLNDDIDAANGNYCSTFSAMNLPAGTYFVRVSASQAFCPACTMGYTLDVVLP